MCRNGVNDSAMSMTTKASVSRFSRRTPADDTEVVPPAERKVVSRVFWRVGFHPDRLFREFCRRLSRDAIPAAGVLALWVTVSAAVEPLDRLETWSQPGTAGWTNTSSQASLTNPGGNLTIGYARQTAPALEADLARVALEPGILVTNLSFRFRSDRVAPSALSVCLHSGKSRRTWCINLKAPPAGGESFYSVRVADSSGWLAVPTASAALFQDDLHSVAWVGVYVRRHGAEGAQNFGLDDFRLQGLISSEDCDIDGMPDEWEKRYGLDAGEWRDASRDADGDGASNYAEFRSGTNPTNAASRFEVKTREDSGGAEAGALLWWNSTSNRFYAVWRTENLKASFERLGEGGIEATPPVNVYRDASATNASAYFYRVQVEE